jgi:Skp family chaperone for outer membrane proteins
MCFGGGGDNGAAAQAEADRLANERREELNRLAREREAIAAQQQAEMQRLAAEQEAAMAAQSQQTAEMKAQQQEQLAGIRARGTAVTQSLQILARQGAQQAPSASVGGKPTVQGAKQTTAGLRIGATGRASGSGTNVAV